MWSVCIYAFVELLVFCYRYQCFKIFGKVFTFNWLECPRDFNFREELHCGIPSCSCATGLRSAMEGLFGACTLALQPWASSAFWIPKPMTEECCSFTCKLSPIFQASAAKNLPSAAHCGPAQNLLDQLGSLQT